MPRSELSVQEQIGALVDERLVALLRETFPAPTVRPGTRMDDVMYGAGQQRAIDFLAECHAAARPDAL